MNYYVYVIHVRARAYVGITTDYYNRMKKGVKSFRGVPSLYEAESRASASEYANRVISSFRKMGISLNENTK